MPRNPDGLIKSKDLNYNGNDIDSLRHSYVIEFYEDTAELLGRLNEDLNPTLNGISSLNMDFWNNLVGRTYGKKLKRGEELFYALLKALNLREYGSLSPS